MIWSLGWKNVWRNKMRSMVVVVAVMLGIFAGVLSIGYMQGLMAQRVFSSIHNEISHVQIHNPDFINNEDISLTINNYDKVINILDTASAVVAYAERSKIVAMAQSDWDATGLVVKGIDPEREKQISELHSHLIEGHYFEKNYKMPSIVIGSKAAENLKLKNWQITEEKLDSIDREFYPESLINKLSVIPGKRYRKEKDFSVALADTLTKKEMKQYSDALIDYFSFYRLRARVRITVVDEAGNIETPVFRVRGIYKTTNSTFDGLTAFVTKDALNKFANLEVNDIHEIAIISTDDVSGHQLAKRLEEYLPENSVMSWKKIAPELAMFADFGKMFGYIYVGIILFALAFGIINTMMMSVLERVKELGMLMAIGMNKKKVFRLIMLESVFLTLTGAVIGMALSGLILSVLAKTGISFSSLEEGYEAIGYSATVYPVITGVNFLGITILVVITGIISSIWPARKALKLNPCEALRTE